MTAAERQQPVAPGHGRLRRRSWILAGVLVALLAAGVGIVRTRQAAARAARAQGVAAALAARAYDRAGMELKAWLEADPQAAEAYFLQAQLAFATGNPSQVEASLARAGALGHSADAVERLYGFMLVRSSRYPEAERVLAPLFERATTPDLELDEALARVYLQTYKLDEAARVLERWQREAPADPRPHLWHTEIDKRDDSDPEKAIGHYRAALERDPNLLEARLGLAETLRAAHRNDEAAAEFEAYLAARPEDVAALIGAGVNRSESGDNEGAAGYLDRALAKEPASPSALKERARVAQIRDGAEAALAFLDRAVAADPYDIEILNRRALVLSQLGRDAQAAADRQRLEVLRADLDRLRVVRNQLNADPSNNALRVEVARWMFEHGQPEAGVEWSRMILSAEPAHPGANRLLAEHYARTGQAGLANFHRLKAGQPAGGGP